MGTLNPSKTDRSKKSLFAPCPWVYSASVVSCWPDTRHATQRRRQGDEQPPCQRPYQNPASVTDATVPPQSSVMDAAAAAIEGAPRGATHGRPGCRRHVQCPRLDRIETHSATWERARPHLRRCEDREQLAVRIEAPPSPNHFPPVSALRPTRLLIKYLGGLSNEDRFVWDTLYWRNGTRKNSKEALDAMMNCNPTWEVVKALLDKHNEDHLLEDLAYEIKEVVSYKDHFPRKDSQHECRSFSHLNVLVERGPNAIKDLLFIEMTCTTDGGFEEYMLSCICVVSSDDDGECCECGDDVKHPTGAEYKKGDDVQHPTGAEYKNDVAKGRVQCGRPISGEEFNEFIVVRDEDWLEAEEAMVRQQFKTFDIADSHGARGEIHHTGRTSTSIDAESMGPSALFHIEEYCNITAIDPSTEITMIALEKSLADSSKLACTAGRTSSGGI
ncbi:hypothetical protein D1007_48029 [Hordeum vulgare]|nr:hypothetical protein D1007_48029 [Hordeum vulgare]